MALTLFAAPLTLWHLLFAAAFAIWLANVVTCRMSVVKTREGQVVEWPYGCAMHAFSVLSLYPPLRESNTTTQSSESTPQFTCCVAVGGVTNLAKLVERRITLG